ncbi:MAG: YggS family pyridoxal phosphate-dependent enzyme [Lachnospiraceae bacterium]|nr:YggS family pyridoxal phosphate-dependent enzyme [Lachnospiraceae bacterium]
MSLISENIQSVEERIQAACARAGRSRDEVTLICVTKTMPVEDLRQAYDAGQRSFGENRVQEINDKFPQLPSDIQWHMIGHLQRNKVKYLMDKAVMIHSVDSAALAQTISKEAVKAGRVMDILLEVNAAEEESKFGLTCADVLPLVREIAPLPGIHICGLMTVAPFTDDPETNRVFFRKLRDLSVDIGRESIDNVSMHILSMGMTGDFEVAIEEGATHIRVGTAIFGKRNYNI